LIKEGRKNIALISNIEELSVGKLRTKGYLNALIDAKHYKNQPIILNISKTDDVETEIEQLLKDNKKIDGIISIDNITGVIALNKALKLGRKVPKDLSIIGFSDENVLHFTEPKLSTISQHSLDIGEKSVNILVDKIENNKTNTETKVIKTKLVLRHTTL
jgi:LacI family transcriptional regulator